jgi:hypothetical protein
MVKAGRTLLAWAGAAQPVTTRLPQLAETNESGPRRLSTVTSRCGVNESARP